MSDQPWKTDKWFVSPWNFNPAVNGGFRFAKSIKFHDVTLRDGEQSPGFHLDANSKLRIARQLEKLGVDVIQTVRGLGYLLTPPDAR